MSIKLPSLFENDIEYENAHLCPCCDREVFIGEIGGSWFINGHNSCRVCGTFPYEATSEREIVTLWNVTVMYMNRILDERGKGVFESDDRNDGAE